MLIFLLAFLLAVSTAFADGGFFPPQGTPGALTSESDTLQTVYNRGETIVLDGTTITNAVCIGDGTTASDTLWCVYVNGAGGVVTVACDGERANCTTTSNLTGITSVTSNPYTLLQSDCGKFLSIETGAGEIDLLADMSNCLVCLYETNAVTLLLDPNGTDTWDVTTYNLENGTALAPAAGDRIQLANVAGNSACFLGTSATAIRLLGGTIGTVTDAN